MGVRSRRLVAAAAVVIAAACSSGESAPPPQQPASVDVSGEQDALAACQAQRQAMLDAGYPDRKRYYALLSEANAHVAAAVVADSKWEQLRDALRQLQLAQEPMTEKEREYAPDFITALHEARAHCLAVGGPDLYSPADGTLYAQASCDYVMGILPLDVTVPETQSGLKAARDEAVRASAGDSSWEPLRAQTQRALTALVDPDVEAWTESLLSAIEEIVAICEALGITPEGA